MQQIQDTITAKELTERINKLTPGTQRVWGTMDVNQMMAHCSVGLQVTLGEVKRTHGLIGKLFGGFAKRSALGPQHFKKGLPTDPAYVVKDKREFEQERQKLLGLIKRLTESEPQSFHRAVHPFFGKMSSDEWNILNYKHLDHRLRQFGV